MKLSFKKLLEAMEIDENPSDPKSVAVVRSGLSIRPEFWDEFIQLTGDAEGMAELLDVSRDQISGWADKIRSAIDKVQQSDDEGSKDKKSEVIPTGEIADPNGHFDYAA